MSKRIKTTTVLCSAVALACCVFLAAVSWAQEMPTPGTVIDKNNYKKYAHLFPKEFAQPAFETGFNGFWKPIVMKISAPSTIPGYPCMPAAFLKLSEKNKGKLGFDAAGNITGGYDYNGLPFPDVTPADKDFAQKIMANQYYRYQWDTDPGDSKHISWDQEKRKGENVKNVGFYGLGSVFVSRLILDPKPFYKTPLGLISANQTNYLTPNGMKGMAMMNEQYLDPRKPDEVYMFLPTMRRVIRGDSSQRSTPIAGTTQAYDDFNGGFAGKFYDFTYKYLGDGKVVASVDNHVPVAKSRAMQAADKDVYLSWNPENFTVRDVYIMEIHSKDPKYPQSKKIIYMDKKTLYIYYSAAWDRAGQLWKIWFTNTYPYKLQNGDWFNLQANQSGIDVQFGYATYFVADRQLNLRQIKWEEYQPAALLMKGR